MKRYYMSAIIGDGSIDNPYRPAIADDGVAFAAVVPTGANGIPLNSHALCVVDTVNHGPLIARHDALPDFPLDGKISALQTATKNAMLTRLAALGLDTASIGNADGFRDVIRGIGVQLGEVGFDENNFDANMV